MAEIKIVKKKPVWPWVILGILLIGTFLILVNNNEKKKDDVVNTQAPVDNTITVYKSKSPANSQLTNFVKYVQEGDTNMGLDHEYTHKAFTLLAEALEETAAKVDYNLKQPVEKLKVKGDILQKDPTSLRHADLIKKGFESAYISFENMQKAKFPEMGKDLNKLQQYSAEMDPNEETLNQKAIVKGFFNEAAKLLDKMNNSTNS